MNISLLRTFRLALLCVGLVIVLGAALTVPLTVVGQTVVMAEAMNQANLRAGPGTDFDLVGEITRGTQYPVIGRHPRFPWLLLQLPDRQGWVFQQLVVVSGDLSTVPFTDVIVGQPPTPALPVTTDPPTDSDATPTPMILAATGTPTEVPTITPTPTPTRPLAVYAEAIDVTNVRFGPGIDYPRIGEIRRGALYAVVRRHAVFPWLEISFAEVASGRGWVFRDTVTVTGDLNAIETTSMTDFGYPTLTPTAAMVVTAAPPWPVSIDLASAPPGLEALGNTIYDYMLSEGFVPRTPRQGSVFLMDLRSGQSFTLNPDVAYSGVSLIKVPLMVAFFRKVAAAPTAEQARLISEMIICSENLSSNALLRLIGDGDEYRGALYVTDTMRELGLENTFLVRSFFTGARVIGPTPTEQPFFPVTIPADQTQTNPDPSNQITPADMGWLLAAIYQCAEDGGGPLTATFPDEITEGECRRMMRVLRANRILALLEAGVPPDITVAHKHGWGNDTHGDGGIIMTPGGDYILVAVLFNRTWLLYEESFPAIAEISRLVYNAYNPARPLAATNTQPVPLCSMEAINAMDPRLLEDLQAFNPPPFR